MAKKNKPEKEIEIQTTDEITQAKEPEKEETELDKAKAEAAANLDRYQRTLAEFDNFRKRTSKEKASMYDDGVRDTIERLLPIIDNFERAVSAMKGENEFEKGVALIFKQLQDFLDAAGVEVIETIGAEFDPNIHFAVAHTEDENAGQNEVTEELQKGYIYKDKVIRCSMVKVAN